VKRREFITLLGGAAAAWPIATRAEQAGTMPLVSIVSPGFDDDPGWQSRLVVLREALAKLGWTEGRNIRFAFRWGANSPQQRRAAAAEMVGLAPSILVAVGTPVSQAMKQASRTIPIVFVGASDPESSGLVSSMAHPGGNLTGFTNFEFSIGTKWLELLREVAPDVKRVLVFLEFDNLGSQGFLRAIEGAASALGIRTTTADSYTNDSIKRGIDTFAQERNGGLIVLPGTPAPEQRNLIVGLATRHLLPAIYAYRPFIADGGLISYHTDNLDLYRRAATYIDPILRGERPGDLPVQVPTKYELVINLNTAKALGLEIPATLLARADEVIE
jgi:putative tryptophan/tyrosine transport system substrate-binding protein